MDYPKFFVSNQKEMSISIQWVKMEFIQYVKGLSNLNNMKVLPMPEQTLCMYLSQDKKIEHF